MITTDVLAILRQYGYATGTEMLVHEGVARVLTTHGISFEREKVLSPRDRIEFYLPVQRLGIECKISGSEASVLRQCMRYMQSEWIDQLALMTNRNKHRRIPESLNKKPLHLVFIGRF